MGKRIPSTEKRVQLARYLQGVGLEIGALSQPLTLPATVTHCFYTDHFDNDDLAIHYKEIPKSQFVNLDFVSDYHGLPFADNTLDFIITNHTIEHAENVFRVIHEFQRVLKPNGILYMAVPDKRSTFDLYRESVSFEHLADEYHNGALQNRETHYREWVHGIHRYFNNGAVLDETTAEAQVKDLMAQNYSIHFHTWQASQFMRHMLQMRSELGIQLQLIDLVTIQINADNEFIVVLRKAHHDTLDWQLLDMKELAIQMLENTERVQYSVRLTMTKREEKIIETLRRLRSWGQKLKK